MDGDGRDGGTGGGGAEAGDPGDPSAHAEELARLRAEVAALRARAGDHPGSPLPPPPGGPVPARPPRWRPRLAVVLVVVASFGVVVSTVATWVQRNVYDADAWVDTVQGLPQDPVVADGLAQWATDELIDATDARARVEDLLPDQAQLLVGPIMSALESGVRSAATTVITSDQFHTVWVALNRFAHERLMTLLLDQGIILRTGGGTVRLDLLPVMAAVLDRVHGVVPGLFSGDDPPTLEAGMPLDEEVSALSEYLGIDLPEDFGQITLVESPALHQAQRAVVWLVGLLVVLLALTAAAAAGAVAVSVRRRRTVLQLGAGAALALVVTWLVARAAIDQAIGGLSGAQARSVARAIAHDVTGGLRQLGVTVLTVAVLVAVVAFLVGPSRPARWLQSRARILADALASAAAHATEGRSAAEWATANEVGLRILGLVLAILGFVVLGPSWGWLGVMAVLFVVWQLAVGVATQVARTEPVPPVAPRPPPPAPIPPTASR